MSYQDTLWIGTKYRDPENELNGVLVIAHSTYGTTPDDRPGIKAWIVRKPDMTFSIFYRHVTGRTAAVATSLERQNFFDQIAYLNFVDHILGEEDRDPTKAEYEQAARDLPGRIERADPLAIFVFGLKHQGYSLPIIKESRWRDRYRATVHVVQDKQHRFFAGLARVREHTASLETAAIATENL